MGLFAMHSFRDINSESEAGFPITWAKTDCGYFRMLLLFKPFVRCHLDIIYPWPFDEHREG